MPAKKYGIYTINNFSYNGNKDPRPCIVIDIVNANTVKVLIGSSQLDMYNPLSHFLLEKSDKNFKSTGLKNSSYFDGQKIVEAHFDRASNTEPYVLDRSYIGHVDGALLKKFKNWI